MMNFGPEDLQYQPLINKLSLHLIARIEFNKNELDFILSDRSNEEKEQGYIQDCPDILIKYYNKVPDKSMFFQILGNAISEDITLYKELLYLLQSNESELKKILEFYLIVKLLNANEQSNVLNGHEKISESISYMELCNLVLERLPDIHPLNKFYLDLIEKIKIINKDNVVYINKNKNLEIPNITKLETDLKLSTKKLDMNVNLALLHMGDNLSNTQKQLLNKIKSLREKIKSFLLELSDIKSNAKRFRSFDTIEYKYSGAIAREMTKDIFSLFPKTLVDDLLQYDNKIAELQAQSDLLNDEVNSHFEQPKGIKKKVKKRKNKIQVSTNLEIVSLASYQPEVLPPISDLIQSTESLSLKEKTIQLEYNLDSYQPEVLPPISHLIQSTESLLLKEKTLQLAYNQSLKENNSYFKEKNHDYSQERIAQQLCELFSTKTKLSELESLIHKLGGKLITCGSGSSHFRIELNNAVGYFCHKHKSGHSNDYLSELALKNIYGTFLKADIFNQYQAEVEFSKLLPSTSRKHQSY